MPARSAGKGGGRVANAQFRHELKYYITNQQAACLAARMRCVLRPDPHAGPGGGYNIRSLYFDDYHDTCYQQNQDGTDPRQKYRIRIYGRSGEVIHLELKRKVRGKTQKLSCPLTEEQCRRLMAGQPLPAQQLQGAPALLQRFCAEMRARLLAPKVIVEYDRIPYICPMGNVRVTLDYNIASSSAVSEFLQPNLPLRPVLPLGGQLLEVKFDEFLPDVIYRSLQLQNMRQTTFSKYYLCRTYKL